MECKDADTAIRIAVCPRNEDGLPFLVTSKGYAMVEREYNSDQLVSLESYFDEEGAPVSSTAGYASVAREYDSSGRISYEAYFDTID